jgi:hypothetical protein
VPTQPHIQWLPWAFSTELNRPVKILHMSEVLPARPIFAFTAGTGATSHKPFYTPIAYLSLYYLQSTIFQFFYHLPSVWYQSPAGLKFRSVQRFRLPPNAAEVPPPGTRVYTTSLRNGYALPWPGSTVQYRNRRLYVNSRRLSGVASLRFVLICSGATEKTNFLLNDLSKVIQVFSSLWGAPYVLHSLL